LENSCILLANKPGLKMKNQQIGKQGEDLAAQLLLEKGFRIVERNYRAGRVELDIIAWAHDRLLVFVEVKTRASENFGGPLDAVDAKKQARMARAAAWYMDSIGYDWEIRFDIVAILLKDDKLQEIRHVEDAFFPTG
jgi:putative endonuclease